MKWHKGPPPHVGWWNASLNQNPSSWRWWNGTEWSIAARDTRSAHAAAVFARTRSRLLKDIRWTDYYPANARVPRVAP